MLGRAMDLQALIVRDPAAQLATLRAHPVRYSWAQDVFELRLLTPDELRAAYPDRVG